MSYSIALITPLGYRISMGKLRTPLIDYFVGKIETEGKGEEDSGKSRWHIIGCFDDEAGATGFAIYLESEDFVRIRYLVADADFAGTEEALLKHIKKRCVQAGAKSLYWDSSDAEAHEEFVKTYGCHLYGITMDKFKPLWYSFAANAQKLVNRIEKRIEESGSHIETKCLKELSDQEREQVIELYRKEKKSDFMKNLMEDAQGKLIESMCNFTFVDGAIAAHVMVEETEFNGCKLSYMDSAEKYRSKGYFMIPLMISVDEGFSLDYERVCWTINEENKFSSKFMKRHFAAMNIIETNVEYRCDIPLAPATISVETMRKSDAYTIANLVPSKELMKRAGQAIFDAARWKEPVAIVCGKGNNAGDGYVVAELLHKAGMDCTIFLLDEDRFSEDGRHYFDICKSSNIPVKLFDSETGFGEYGSILDAILGTGFSGDVKGITAEAINAINTRGAEGAYIVSADINSGLNGDTGEGTTFVRSDLTVSIGTFKHGHFRGRSDEAMKEKVNCDIGIVIVE